MQEEDSTYMHENDSSESSSDAHVYYLMQHIIDDYTEIMFIKELEDYQTLDDSETEIFALRFISYLLIKIRTTSKLLSNICAVESRLGALQLNPALRSMKERTLFLDDYLTSNFRYIVVVIADYYTQELNLADYHNFENRMCYLKTQLKYYLFYLEMLEFEAHEQQALCHWLDRCDFEMSTCALVDSSTTHNLELCVDKQVYAFQRQYWLMERIAYVEEGILEVLAQINQLDIY